MVSSKEYIQTFFYKNKLATALTIFVYIANSLLSVAVSWYLQVLFDSIMKHSQDDLPRLTFLFLGVIVTVILLTTIQYLAYPRFIERAMMQYRDKAFKDLLAKNIASFSNENTSTYISAFTNDLILIQDEYLKNIFQFIQMCIMLIGSLSLMFMYSVSLTIIAIALSILPFLASIIFGGKLAEQERIVSESNESYVATLKDILSGFSIIKSFQAEEDVHRQFYKTSQRLEQNKKKANQTKELVTGIGTVASIIAQFGVMLIGAYFAIGGVNNVTLGMVIAFSNLMNFVIQPLATIPQLLAKRKAAKELVTKLSENLKHNHVQIGEALAVEEGCPPIIKLDELSYYYSEQEKALSDISLMLEPKKVYGVVGGSGSGKSTLLHSLMKTSDTYQGNIYFNEQELRNISVESLYKTMSLIQQEVFIFDATITDNVTMFKQFSREQVDRALELSGLSSVVNEKGVDYLVGENGKHLSGGERQRVAIARALIRNNSVLLVDEVTSALDNITAHQIDHMLFELTNTTRVVITHRLEEQSLKRFDTIFVMKNGSVVEQGDFDTLMDQKGYFYSLYVVGN